MTQVYGNIQFVDTTALSDSQVFCDVTHPYSRPELFHEERQEYSNVAHISLNAWLLDGNYPVAGVHYAYPLMTGLSKADCTFDENPIVYVQFNEKHSSNGITLYFNEDLPTFTVTYKQNGTNLKSESYTATSYAFFCEGACDGYDEIVIEFTKTTQPYRAILLSYIEYGTTLEFTTENVMSATLSEKIDVTGASIPFNTLQIKINDSENAFNPQNDYGLWRYIQSGQKLNIYEYVNGADIPLGTFYIDSWDYRDASATFDCISPIGLLDKVMYDGWVTPNGLSGVSATSLMEGIFDSVGFEDYEISEDFNYLMVQGMIPRMTVRDAIQQVAFAVGAVVDDSRGYKVRIYTPDRNMDSIIGRNRKFQGKTNGSLDDYVNKVLINVTKYTVKTDKSEVFNGILPSGANPIYFSEPIKSPTGTNCTIYFRTPCLIEVTPTDPTQPCVVEAYTYDTNDFSVSAEVEVEPGQSPQAKEYSGLTVYNVATLPTLAKNLLEYHRLRQTLELEYLCDTEKVGEWVGVEDTVEEFKTATTMIEGQDIDLTGGFIAKAKCRGYSTVTTPLYEMGNDELNMAEDYII